MSDVIDKTLNYLLILICAVVLLCSALYLSGCASFSDVTKATKGVVRIYKEAESKVDDLNKYCVEMGNFLSICQNPECTRMLVRHNHFCDSVNKFLNEIEEVKDDIISAE